MGLSSPYYEDLIFPVIDRVFTKAKLTENSIPSTTIVVVRHGAKGSTICMLGSRRVYGFIVLRVRPTSTWFLTNIPYTKMDSILPFPNAKT